MVVVRLRARQIEETTKLIVNNENFRKDISENSLQSCGSELVLKSD